LHSFYAFAEKTDNDIVNDYFDNLQRIENETQSFKTKPIGEWDFVNNPSGGFLGIHWGWRKLRDVRVYLQIAQGKLCFKVEDFDHNRERALGLHETISKLAVAEVVNEVVPRRASAWVITRLSPLWSMECWRLPNQESRPPSGTFFCVAESFF